jgi:transcription antitermination factor NusG
VKLNEIKDLLENEILKEMSFTALADAQDAAAKKSKSTNHKFVVLKNAAKSIFKVVAFELYDHWSRAQKKEWPRVLREGLDEIKDVESYQPPKIEVGDEVKVGKFKNRKAKVKSITKDKNNQPVLKTNKGEHKLFNPRITKLEDEKEEK